MNVTSASARGRSRAPARTPRDIKEEIMPSSNGSARVRLVSCLLAALACGLAVGEARAVPIPAQITYSTSGPEPLRTSSGDVVFEFQPVTNGVAPSDSLVRLGTILIHGQSPGEDPRSDHATTSFDNVFVRLAFSVTAVNGEAVAGPDATVSIYNLLSGSVWGDGRVDVALATFTEFHEGSDGSVQGGGIRLTLKPPANDWVVSLQSPAGDESVATVDVYAQLEGAPVPEPSVLLIFAAAAGFGWKRLGSRKSRRP
jgi:hypothetical protein